MALSSGLTALADERFVSLTTFRRTGLGVPTPVWVARDGDALVVTTGGRTGKAKRIRNDARVELRPCSRLGAVERDAPSIAARAEVVTDVRRMRSATAALHVKYGLQLRAVLNVERFLARTRGFERVILRITDA